MWKKSSSVSTASSGPTRRFTPFGSLALYWCILAISTFALLSRVFLVESTNGNTKDSATIEEVELFEADGGISESGISDQPSLIDALTERESGKQGNGATKSDVSPRTVTPERHPPASEAKIGEEEHLEDAREKDSSDVTKMPSEESTNPGPEIVEEEASSIGEEDTPRTLSTAVPTKAQTSKSSRKPKRSSKVKPSSTESIQDTSKGDPNAARAKDDNLDVRSLPEYHATTLTHLMMPFPPRQVKRVKETVEMWWKAYPPCYAGDFDRLTEWRQRTNNDVESIQRPPTLIFTIMRRIELNETEVEARIKDEEYRTMVREAVNLTHISPCFSSFKFCVARLTPEQDQRFTGSRMLYEMFLTGELCVTGRRGYGFYMEPDNRPLQKRWLTQLAATIAYPARPFWVIGSTHRGTHVVDPSFREGRYHMNGNSLVRLTNSPLGDEDEPSNRSSEQSAWPVQAGSYADFYFNKVRAYIIRIRGANASRPYDTDIYKYMFDKAHYDVVMSEVVHQIKFTPFMVNLFQSAWDPATVLEEFGKETLIAHGGYPAYVPGELGEDEAIA